MYQPGIFALGNPENVYLEFDLKPGAKFVDLVSKLANLSEPLTTAGGVNLVIGLRPSALRELNPDAVPEDAADFDEPIVGKDGYTMPATQHDAWLWLAGADRPNTFDNAVTVVQELASVATVASEVWGWHYKESRDLTGFVDGTENPPMLEAPETVIVPEDKPGAGSTVLLYQQWEHHINKWMGASTKTQEETIGRTKDTDIEMDPKPEHSHVARTVVEVDGEELDMFRRNVAYGGATNHGTLFVGFSIDQWRQAEMLRRMAGVGDGIRDHLTNYTTPLNGAFYVVPDAGVLAEFMEEPEED